MTDLPHPIRVIGIGNRDRGDDGLGPLVAERLQKKIPGDVAVIARHGDVLSLLDDWMGAEAAILVDAAASITAPGIIHRIDLIAEMIPPEFSLASTHAFGISQAVGLGRTLGILPPSLILYAVEAATFDPGFALTSKVLAAAETVVQRILGEVAALRHATRHIGSSAHA